MPKIFRHGLYFHPAASDITIEMEFIKLGGRILNKKSGKMAGLGLAHHFKEAAKLIWPKIVWHKWNELIVAQYVANRGVVILGPSSSGKTHSVAVCLLVDYYCFPDTTTVIVCSTTRDRLEDRIWGEIKKLHREATNRFRWLPGHLIEGKQRIVTDDRSEASEGRDFRNGVVGVPCKKGESFVGIGDFAGIKNKRVRLAGDELSLLPRVFVDAVSNLDKNPDFKCIGLGNPKDTTDALGVMAEPAATHGGWDGGIDQTPITKTWPCRREGTVAVQLVGSESPNLDGKLGIPLLCQADIDRDVSFYGKESLWYSMMNQGMMPRGQGTRRVITRQLCLKHHALEDPIWLNNVRTRFCSLDAAYRGVGGDRCVFTVFEFGAEGTEISTEEMPNLVAQALVGDRNAASSRPQIVALTDVLLVPVNPGDFDRSSPEDQIVNFVKGQCEQRGIPPERFFFDAGMRTSLVSSFSRLWSPNVVSIDCGGKPTHRKVSYDIDVVCADYYSKLITEFWWSVRLIIEAGQFRGMTEDVMMEFCSREFQMVGANKIEIEPKEKMKLKTGRSPDLADSVAIGIEGARRLGFVIKRVASREAVNHDDRWKRTLRQKVRDLFASKELQSA